MCAIMHIILIPESGGINNNLSVRVRACVRACMHYQIAFIAVLTLQLCMRIAHSLNPSAKSTRIMMHGVAQCACH